MKRLKILAALLPAVFLIMLSPSCSEDFPEERSAVDVLGIFSDGDGHYLEFVDPDHMYEYEYLKTEKYEFWLQRPEVYFYEPHSRLMARENSEGVLQIFRMMNVDEDGMDLCWVADPELNGLEGDAKYDLLRMFVKNEYDYDPANTISYRRVSPEELKAAIGDVEVIIP